MSGGANLAAVLEARAVAGGWGNRPAFAVGDEVFTHGQVHDGAARAAGVLAARGCRPGHRVLLALPDGIEFVWAFLGAVRLGAVAVPVNPRLTPTDHALAAADAGPSVVVCGPELTDRFPGAEVVTSDHLAPGPAGSSPSPPAEVGPRHPAYAQFTSGTTGRPRAALHAHGDPAVYFEAFARPALALGADDVVLSVSKLYFAYGLGNSMLFPLLSGARAVLLAERPRPEVVAEAVARHSVTVLFGVPTFYAHLVAAGPSLGSARVRVAVSAGESLTVALAGRAREFLGCPLLDGLGSTEVGQTFASNTPTHAREATVGRALPPYRLAVGDEPDDPLGPGRVGRLWVAGPTLLLGYLGPPGTPGPERRGEWLATGDRASIGADGFVTLAGRVDDLEMVGGMSVSPQEVESVLAAHPAVTEVAVASVVDGDGASRLRAFVVPAPGWGPAEGVAGELLDLARARLAPFKVPRTVTFVGRLPRTPTGKLRRFVVRRGGWDGAGTGPAQADSPP